MNSNILENRACPSCRQAQQFDVESIATFRMHDDGASHHTDVHYDDNSATSCPECGWSGKWGDTLMVSEIGARLTTEQARGLMALVTRGLLTIRYNDLAQWHGPVTIESRDADMCWLRPDYDPGSLGFAFSLENLWWDGEALNNTSTNVDSVKVFRSLSPLTKADQAAEVAAYIETLPKLPNAES